MKSDQFQISQPAASHSMENLNRLIAVPNRHDITVFLPVFLSGCRWMMTMMMMMLCGWDFLMQLLVRPVVVWAKWKLRKTACRVSNYPREEQIGLYLPGRNWDGRSSFNPDCKYTLLHDTVVPFLFRFFNSQKNTESDEFGKCWYLSLYRNHNHYGILFLRYTCIFPVFWCISYIFMYLEFSDTCALFYFML